MQYGKFDRCDVWSAEALQVPMTTSDRLDRWASLLEAESGDICLLERTEYELPHLRKALRGDFSPLTVAFSDPVLRFHGLNGERYGDAKIFFRMNNHRLHRIVCACSYYNRRSVPAAEIAIKVRRAASVARWKEAIFAFCG